MIKADAVEAVFERHHALNLMRLDHGTEHIAHEQSVPASGDGRTAQVIRHREHATEVVRRMSPLGSKPGVVVIEPTNHRPNIERRAHRLELERGAGHSHTARHSRTRHNRSEQLGARWIVERQHAATQRIHQAMACGLHRLLAAGHIVIKHVVRNIDQHLVGVRAFRITNSVVGHVFLV